MDYSNHPNTRLVEFSNDRFVPSCQVYSKPKWKKPVYGPKCPIFKWSAMSPDFTIWIPDTQSIWYSDESGIWVSSIQMVTVIECQISVTKSEQKRW